MFFHLLSRAPLRRRGAAPRRRLRCCLAAVWLTAALACDSAAERARREEASSLVHAIAQLRRAPNPAKRPLLKQLERLPCSSEQLCELKRVCSKAYQRHQRALDSARSLRHALRADGGTAVPGSTAELVADAQRYLKRARFLTRRCTELEGKINRRYGL